jgi:hypothetical protein
MSSPAIERLLFEVRQRYGASALSPYGSSSEEVHGTCFIIAGIPATFSVHTQDGELPEGYYDIQIEGIPPGEYVYTEVVTLETFLELVARVSGPETQWP